MLTFSLTQLVLGGILILLVLVISITWLIINIASEVVEEEFPNYIEDTDNE